MSSPAGALHMALTHLSGLKAVHWAILRMNLESQQIVIVRLWPQQLQLLGAVVAWHQVRYAGKRAKAVTDWLITRFPLGTGTDPIRSVPLIQITSKHLEIWRKLPLCSSFSMRASPDLSSQTWRSMLTRQNERPCPASGSYIMTPIKCYRKYKLL